MLRLTISFTFFFCTILGSFGQQNKNAEYLITQENDTLNGKIKRVNFFNARTIKITTEKETQRLHIKDIKSIYVDQTIFVNPNIKRKSKKDSPEHLLIPHITGGNIALYEKKAKPIFVKNDKIFRLNQLKYYADDFIKLDHFLTHNKENTDSLLVFIEEYNDFRKKFPFNKSFAEKNMHKKDFFNPQVALNFIAIFPYYAYVGMELGLSKDFVVIPRFSGFLVQKNASSLGIQPTAEMGLRYYFSDNQNIKNDVITYKNSGSYISSFYMVPMNRNINSSQSLRLTVGHKKVAYNRLYLDFNIGATNLLRSDEMTFWFNSGIGFVIL